MVFFILPAKNSISAAYIWAKTVPKQLFSASVSNALPNNALASQLPR